MLEFTRGQSEKPPFGIGPRGPLSHATSHHIHHMLHHVVQVQMITYDMTLKYVIIMNTSIKIIKGRSTMK